MEEAKGKHRKTHVAQRGGKTRKRTKDRGFEQVERRARSSKHGIDSRIDPAESSTLPTESSTENSERGDRNVLSTFFAAFIHAHTGVREYNCTLNVGGQHDDCCW